MKHVRKISRGPAQAQSGLCDNIDNDYQAMLCFMIQLLTAFFLPLADIKKPEEETTA